MPVATGSVPPVDRISSPSSKQSIEEVCFTAALILLEGHYTDSPTIPGPATHGKVNQMIARTLDKTRTLKDVREALSQNVEIWIYLTKIFAAAVPSLSTRSVLPDNHNESERNGTAHDTTTSLILRNYATLKEDLMMLTKLMHIARNLLVTAEPEVPQDICAAVFFDSMVQQTIIVAINVTSKGYEAEVLDDASRSRLNEINELYKKLLVTSLQQIHNWTAKNDRNKMRFWYEVMFDEEAMDEPVFDGDGPTVRSDLVRTEMANWLERNAHVCSKAKKLLVEYASTHERKAPGVPTGISPVGATWIPGYKARIDPDNYATKNSRWDTKIDNKFDQDRAYGRVSHEIDLWWQNARDQNFDEWVVPMFSKEFALGRQETHYQSLLNRYPIYRPEDEEDVAEESENDDPDHDQSDNPDHSQIQNGNQNGTQTTASAQNRQQLPQGQAPADSQADEENESRNLVQEYVDDMIEEEEEMDDNESYGEGPMTGLLTEIPNILDPKQIEALHMIIKSCILDSVGSGPNKHGENLQRTRCQQFAVLDCGKSLLREILVFIAVWDKDETSLIFELTTSIVEALHASALVPYCWNALRIPKDIVSPAQAVLLRVLSQMFRKKYVASPSPPPLLQDGLDLKLIHYLFSTIRSRIVPECLAHMRMQGEIRREVLDPADFPSDTWDMERHRDGLAGCLDFLATIAEIEDVRAKLIEWEAAFELIYLLKGLEDGVPKKPLVELPKVNHRPPQEHPYSHDDPNFPPPPPPQPPPRADEPAYKFPWGGIKIQALALLASLLQPARGKSGPGNPAVQATIMRERGIVPLLNCCAYDDNNRFARERVQLCLKYLMDGSEDANNFLRELVRQTPMNPTRVNYQGAPPNGDAGVIASTSLRIDGIEGEVKVQVRSAAAVAPAAATRQDHSRPVAGPAPPPPRGAAIEEDFM